MTKKTGLPRTLQEQLDDERFPHGVPEQSPEEFAAEFFGQADKPQDDKGLPSLEWLKSTFKTKSACIRYLINQNFAVKDIAKHMGVKYQHVRNVATSPLKRGPNEDWRKPLLPHAVEDAQNFQPQPQPNISEEDDDDET